MQASKFNVRVPFDGRGEVFLMNTLTDAQLVVSSDVESLLDRVSGSTPSLGPWTSDERETIALLSEHGFIVESHEESAQRSRRSSMTCVRISANCGSPS